MPADKKWSDIKCTTVNEKEYKVKEFYDDRFGDIHLMTPKNGLSQLIFRKDYITNSQKEAMTKIAVLEERMHLQHNHMSRLLGWGAVNKKDFCNNHYEICAYYDFPSSCARTWDNAAGVKGGLKPVAHDDLTHMVYQLLIVEAHLNHGGRCYQDVRPTHVGIRNFDKSDYELVDRLRYPMDAEEVNTNHMLYGQLLYCSPALFKHVVTKSKKKCDDNRAKSDVFSIGMTILALGLDHSVQDCYDMKNKKFNEDKLNGYIHDFDTRYGHENKLLCDIVRYCLEEKDHERFTAQELLDRVECYTTVANYLRNGPQVCEEVVVRHEPVVCRQEPVVCTEEVRPTVCYGERRPVAVYKIVNGERILVEGTPVEDYASNVVRQSYREPVTTEVRRSSRRVIEAPTTSTVVRRSVQEPTVVRRSHVEGSRVVVADGVTTGNVVRRSRRVIQGGATRVEGDVIRSSRVVQGEVRRVEGEVRTGAIRRVDAPVTTTGEVRRVEGGVRRVEGEVRTGAIRRVDAPTTTTGVVRRVSGDAPVEGVVRRVSGDAPVEGVVRRVSGDNVQGTVRRVSGENQVEGVVRRVSGDATEGVVRKVSGDNVERKVSGSS